MEKQGWLAHNNLRKNSLLTSESLGLKPRSPDFHGFFDNSFPLLLANLWFSWSLDKQCKKTILLIYSSRLSIYSCTLLFWFILFSCFYFSNFILHGPFIASTIKSLLDTLWNTDNTSDINKFPSLNLSIHKESLFPFLYKPLIVLSPLIQPAHSLPVDN